MDNLVPGKNRRVLIASANPLFAKGLQKLFQERWGGQSEVVGMTRNLEDTLQAMETLQPDLVVVDYDDASMNRDEFMSHFVAGKRPMQVMLVSLRGEEGVVVYDRSTFTHSQAEDWLNIPKTPRPGTDAGQLRVPQPGQAIKHFVTVMVLILLSTVLVYLGLLNLNLLPVQASTQAGPIDEMFNLHFIIISFLFSMIVVFMIYSVIVFRRKPGETGDGAHMHGNNRLEAAWTAIPLMIVLGVSYYGSVNLGEVSRPDPQAMEVIVTGGQWFWSYEYPEWGITSRELYLPVNQQVLLKLTSLDVIHSFWVPEFRVKQDLLPGEQFVRELRITPTEPGEYQVLCAEMCGVSHAYMTSPVFVVEQDEFESWIEQQSAVVAQDPVARGRALSEANGCLSCHSIDGSDGVGPTWLRISGEDVILEDGTSVVRDDEYLEESIEDPSEKIVNGFRDIMPDNYDEIFEDQEIQDLIAFIQSLQ